MQTYSEIRSLISTLIDEGMIIGLRAQGLSVDLVDHKITAKALQLVTMMDSTVTLVADVHEVVTIHHAILARMELNRPTTRTLPTTF